MLKKLTGLIAGVMVAGSAMGWTIQWDDQRYIAGGNDCEKDQTVFAIAAGEEISFIMTDLGTNLSGFAGGRTSERKHCNLVIPATVKQGWYLGKLTQRIHGGFVKSGRSEGKIAVSASFYNNRVRPLTVSTNQWRSNSVPYFTRENATYFEVQPRYCVRDYRGLMRANLVVTGQRGTIDDSIVIQADGYDVKFETVAQIFKCP